MPFLDAFVESLIHEQDKLIKMGVLNASKNQALLVGDSGKEKSKWKQKGKENKNVDSNSKENHIPSYVASGSKKNKNKKFDKSKWSYCMKGFHPESHCINTIIEKLSKFLEHNNISLPPGTNKYEDGH